MGVLGVLDSWGITGTENYDNITINSKVVYLKTPYVSLISWFIRRSMRRFWGGFDPSLKWIMKKLRSKRKLPSVSLNDLWDKIKVT